MAWGDCFPSPSVESDITSPFLPEQETANLLSRLTCMERPKAITELMSHTLQVLLIWDHLEMKVQLLSCGNLVCEGQRDFAVSESPREGVFYFAT